MLPVLTGSGCVCWLGQPSGSLSGSESSRWQGLGDQCDARDQTGVLHTMQVSLTPALSSSYILMGLMRGWELSSLLVLSSFS